MALTGLLSLLSLLLAGCGSPSYQCGNASSGHCYGVVSWNQGTAIDGSIVSIQNVTLSGADIHLNNEMWLIQSKGFYWVEAGFKYEPGYSNDDIFFWSQNLPNQGYSNHYQGSVPSNDSFSDFMIDRIDQNSFRIAMTTTTGGGSYLIYNSTNNTMVPDRVVNGMELAGTYGGNAPTASFIGPGWFNATSNNLYFESSDGTIRSDTPPSGQWLYAPSSNYVAIFQTRCC